MKRSLIILLHIGYWTLYLLLIFIFAVFLKVSNQKALIHEADLMQEFVKAMTALAVLPAIISFYTFYNLLFKRFLSKRKLGSLAIGALITILVSGLIGSVTVNSLNGNFFPWNYSFKPMFQITLFIAVLSLIHGIISLIIRGFINWYSEIRIKEQLQQQNFEMELALIRSQLSPHFLFNTINNIDVLILKDPAKASAYLNKLSDIMRFMLYETKTERIPLQQELDYISKYIELQKIRNSNAEFVKYTVEGNAGNWFIAPMLFIPFIENSFKHSGNKNVAAAIVIEISINEGMLRFTCINQYSQAIKSSPEPGGIGNELMEKRLNLLYPDAHELVTERQSDLYRVSLIIYSGEKNNHA